MTNKEASVLVEWTKSGLAGEDSGGRVSDITVFTDGRMRLGPRLGGGDVTWHSLSLGELDRLRRFAFEEKTIMDIDGETLAREVQNAAAERGNAVNSAAAELIAAPQMDAGTTVLRAVDSGKAHEVSYYDLFGDAERYPEIEALQKLRSIELQLLQIAETYATRNQ